MPEGSPKQYVVAQGDCISSIALAKGFKWETIWNYASNSELKKLRKDPNILLPGDVLIIPPKTRKEVSRATEAKHKFVKKGTPAKIKMRLLQEGKPRANVSYIFTVEGKIHRDKTGADGYLMFPIPPNAKSFR